MPKQRPACIVAVIITFGPSTHLCYFKNRRFCEMASSASHHATVRLAHILFAFLMLMLLIAIGKDCSLIVHVQPHRCAHHNMCKHVSAIIVYAINFTSVHPLVRSPRNCVAITCRYNAMVTLGTALFWSARSPGGVQRSNDVHINV